MQEVIIFSVLKSKEKIVPLHPISYLSKFSYYLTSSFYYFLITIYANTRS